MDAARGTQVFCGYCPDPICKKQLFFPFYLSSSIECTSCGQHHEKSALLEVKPVSDPGVAIRNLIQNILISSVGVTKKCSESVKVKGLSNYQCKLVSPLLTKYGLDRLSGTVKLLRDMGQGCIFDCSHLSDRAFQIEEEHLNVHGYGVDRTGATEYLKPTLERIQHITGQRGALVPIHADGDGHCLVHAISRALVGRELFWHPLMENLKDNLQTNFQTYKLQFSDFIDDVEWRSIIAEADPNYEPTDGEPLGLRNIHIFGLANVLKRAIILLDGAEDMSSMGHYGGVYLPALCSPNMCKGKDGTLNRPVVIAWSSPGRNHFVPLVGIKTPTLPKIPQALLPVPWGVPAELMPQYIDFDENAMCSVGGLKCLQDRYLQRLVNAMERKFQDIYKISPELVADVYQHIFKPSGVVGVSPQLVTESTRVAVEEYRLYRCLTCSVVIEYIVALNDSTLKPNGQLYQIAVNSNGALRENVSYRFPQHNNIICWYDKAKDVLVPTKDSTACKYCKGLLRLVNRDGSLQYVNGDRTTTISVGSKCQCGYKHFWDGKEYDNLPERLKVILEWNNATKEDYVYWFQNESDVSLNSNAYELAQKLIQKHFPGEFGSERLKQRVVDQIFMQTIQNNKGPETQPSIGASGHSVPTKIILKGEKTKTLHKEELGVSNTEKVIRKRVEHAAAVQQKRTSAQGPKEEKAVTQNSTLSLEKSEASPAKQNVAMQSPPAGASSSPSKEKKIRLSAANASHTTVSLSENMTFHDLQDIIERELGVPKERQIIKYGFPPKILQEPDESKKDHPLPLQHGDRVLIDQKVMKEPQDMAKAVQQSRIVDSGAMAQEEEIPSREQNDLLASRRDEEAASDEELRSLVQSRLLSVLEDSDLWPWAQDKPSLFRADGLFYNQVQKDIGPLVDGQHCTLPFFPGKVFCYIESQDELFLCLGKSHIPVQPLSPDVVSLTEPGMHHSSPEYHTFQHGEREIGTLLGSSRKDPKVVAFSGKGRSLSEDQEGTGSRELASLKTASGGMPCISGSAVLGVREAEVIPEENSIERTGTLQNSHVEEKRMNENSMDTTTGAEHLTQPLEGVQPYQPKSPSSWPEIAGLMAAETIERKQNTVSFGEIANPVASVIVGAPSPMSPDFHDLEVLPGTSVESPVQEADKSAVNDNIGHTTESEEKNLPTRGTSTSDAFQNLVPGNVYGEETCHMMDVDVLGHTCAKDDANISGANDARMTDSNWSQCHSFDEESREIKEMASEGRPATSTKVQDMGTPME